MNSRLFRTDALEHKKNRLYGDVIISHPLPIYIISIGILIMVVMFIIFLFKSSYSRHETVTGYIVPDKGLVKVYAPLRGELVRQHVIEGQNIEKGQLLFSIQTLSANNEGGDRDSLLLIELQGQKKSINEKIEQEYQLKESKLLSVREQIEGRKEELVQIKESIELQRQKLLLVTQKIEELTPLVNQGHLPKREMDATRQARINAQISIQDNRRQIVQLENHLTELYQELKQIPLEWQSLQSDLTKMLSGIELQLVEVSGRREYAIRSPVSGRLTALLVAEGQTLSTQSPLIAILPEGTKLYAELFLPTRAAGFIKTNQDVLLRYGAFPYQRYGLHRGQVINIAQVILRPDELPIPVALNESVYRVKVSLENQTVNAFGKAFPLQAGMLLDADIVLEKRSLIEWLLEPIYGLRGSL